MEPSRPRARGALAPALSAVPLGVVLLGVVALGVVALGVIALGVVISPRPAAACATCEVGDPTLTVMGAGTPFRHRIRLAAEVEHRTARIGEPRIDALALSEQRAHLSVAYTPHDELTLSLSLPVAYRRVTRVNLSEERVFGPGDLMLRARGYVYRDRAFAPEHLLFVQGGLEMPTALRHRDDNGALFPLELQLGTGSWDPLAGLGYTFLRAPWSLYLSSVLIVPTEGYAGTRAGPALRSSATLQYQPWDVLGFRVGVDTSVEGRTVQLGETDPHAGGFIGFASFGVVAAPGADWLVYARVRVPALDALRGAHEEGPIFGFGVSTDV